MEDPEVTKLQNLLTELSQSKAPIGKQQIVEVTKAAMTAIRHFKHVVHAVEKFILKCKSQHKLAGFYMIDSIVRQGQKKFKHKDVFGPRFAVNLRQTLENALTCPTKERLKVVRQLNLWRANKVFGDEVLRPLLQHCRASGLDVDVMAVEIAVKGTKADFSRYGNNLDSLSPTKTVSSAPSHSNTSIQNDSFLLKLLKDANPEYEKVFSTNSRALQKVQDFLNDNIKKSLNSSSKNKIQNILSEEFDYSDEDSGDENKTSVDINSVSKEQLDQTTESLMKNSNILSEIRHIFLQNGGTDSHGSSSRHDDRDRKRRRSRSSSRDRKDSDRKREKGGKSKERGSRRRSRSSTPPRHREDKREKERRKLGFPQEPKREHFLIGSRTIWLGRLPANCSEVEIKNALTDVGTPDKIQIINSRACSYVTMPDRRSAYKIIDRLSDKLEVSRRLVKVSWATGEGLKDDSKLLDFWDKQRGFHEIPWKSLPSQIDKLFEGGWADVETLPPKFKDMYDEKGKLLKPKTPEFSPPNLSHVPLPPPEHPVYQQPPPSMPPTAVPPPMPSFQPGMLPPGLGLPPPSLDNKDPNLEMLMAAVANGNNSQGILGVPPQLNPALLNTLNALNARQQLVNASRPQFPRNEMSLPDQQAAFQNFRGNVPRPFMNDFNPNFHSPRSFSPRNRGGFNNGNRFPRPDMNNSLPNMAEPPPIHFSVPPPRLPMDFSQPPPNLNPVQSEQQQQQEEPMDIASPDGPPGV